MKLRETRPELYTLLSVYFHRYLDLIETDSIVESMEQTKAEVLELFTPLKVHANFSYAEGKWTISELLQHMVDCELIFTYRAFRLSRLDATEMEGFEEDHYVANAPPTSFDRLLTDFHLHRTTAITLYQDLSDEQLKFVGSANKHPVSTEALGYLFSGHVAHHCQILKKRYLPELQMLD